MSADVEVVLLLLNAMAKGCAVDAPAAAGSRPRSLAICNFCVKAEGSDRGVNYRNKIAS